MTMPTPPLPAEPHRRHNPLNGGAVLVSAQRTQRPWQGAEESPADEERPTYDPECYLCPGNRRVTGDENPVYRSTFAFTNDFAALRPEVEQQSSGEHPLFRAETQPGTCRVICFHPRHDLTLAQMSAGELAAVTDLWVQQVQELGPRYRWVQIFENRGEAMGASNPHPHGQVWASAALPTEALAEDAGQRAYLAAHGTPLLCEYADAEAALGDRVVAGNGHWLAVVPYWAVWPFELLLLPRRHVSRLTGLSAAEREALSPVLHEVLVRYDNLFNHPFPYSMGWHGAPGLDEEAPHWQLHAHFYPPLLRSATVRKFMVGYEMLADAQRDITPEQAADRLRAVSDVHYRAAAGAWDQGEAR